MKLKLFKRYFLFATMIASFAVIPVACSSDDGDVPPPPVVEDPIADPANDNTTIEASSPVVADGTASSTVTITIADTDGNLFTESAGTVALATTGAAVLSDVTDNSDGTYTATVTDSVAETVTISGTLNDVAIADTSDIVFEADSTGTTAEADPTNANTTITATVPEVVEDTLLRSTVTVQLAAADGVLLTTTGGTIALTQTGSDTATISDVVDNEDGTYTATVTNTMVDEDEVVTVTGTLDDVAITNTAEISFEAPDAPNPATEAEQSTEPVGPTILAINSGGGEVMVGDVTFTADQYFTGPSETYTNPMLTEIEGTEDDEIYLTERVTTDDDRNGPFSYEIPVTAGTYTVKLYFAEIFWGVPNPRGIDGGEGDRIFSISMEDMSIFTEYDLFKDVGPATADQRMYDVEVTDGILNITFEASVDKPKVSAIEIFSEDGSIL